MSIGISEEHTELAASLRSWAGALDGPGLARAAEGDESAGFAEAWKALVEMGVPAIAVAEEHGGGGGGPRGGRGGGDAKGREGGGGSRGNGGGCRRRGTARAH